MTEEILNEIEIDIASCRSPNKARRRRSLTKYYSNPNYCKYCGKMLKILIGSTSRSTVVKNFCNHSCAASFNNALVPKREKMPKREKGISPERKAVITENSTKIELRNRRSGYQSARNAIRKRAYRTYELSGKPKSCSVCGYDKYFEVCHIKSVSSFTNDILISEINHIDNLIALCPNCHWEFDHNLILI